MGSVIGVLVFFVVVLIVLIVVIGGATSFGLGATWCLCLTPCLGCLIKQKKIAHVETIDDEEAEPTREEQPQEEVEDESLHKKLIQLMADTSGCKDVEVEEVEEEEEEVVEN